jgi:glycosyltransferase involved in cell wall biosynthesis
MPEILGDSAVYFDPQNKADFLEKVEKIFKDQNLRAEMIDRGKKHQQKYNWWECAFRTWHIYLEQFLWK